MLRGEAFPGRSRVTVAFTDGVCLEYYDADWADDIREQEGLFRRKLIWMS
jgi:hypothetical protein